jgi:hypothetical protein
VSITIPEQHGRIARVVHHPKGASVRLADQIRKGLEQSGVPTGKKLEQQPNAIVIEAKVMDMGVTPEHRSTSVGSIDDVVVISPIDAEPREASLADMPEWMKEQGAVFGGKAA